MRTAIRIAKGLGVILAACVLFVILVVNFGTIESRLVCTGQVVRQPTNGERITTAATLYADVETYRWIVFWADHDAMIRWEIQPGGRTGFGYYNHSSFATPITDFTVARASGPFRG